jgi:hypothetical protein
LTKEGLNNIKPWCFLPTFGGVPQELPFDPISAKEKVTAMCLNKKRRRASVWHIFILIFIILTQKTYFILSGRKLDYRAATFIFMAQFCQYSELGCQSRHFNDI